MTPEGKLLKKVLAHAQALSVQAIRMSFARGVTTGWPDLLILLPRSPLFMELKAPKGVVSKIQEHRLKTLTELGYDVAVVYSFDQACEAIARALDSAAVHGAGGRAPDDTSHRRPPASAKRKKNVNNAVGV